MNEGENWLRFAHEDFRVAKLVMKEKIYDQVYFHSQQCAEKSLKAWLAAQEANIPKTYRLTDLLPLVPPRLFGDLRTSGRNPKVDGSIHYRKIHVNLC